MKPKSTISNPLICIVFALALQPSLSLATAYTWDGGGADNNWATDANWVGDPATDIATGDTLTFAGTTQLTSNNNLTGLTLANTSNAIAFNFASGAGAYVITGNALTVGTTGANAVLAYNQSTSNVEIQNAITFAGNNRDVNIGFASGAGQIKLTGNINFNSSIMGLGTAGGTTSAGTLVLSGINTGVGKSNQITGGGNSFRAINWTNVDNNRIILGSDSALGSSTTGSITSGTGVLNGILTSKILYVSTSGGDRNLSGNTFGITGGRLEFDGANNLTIGNVINSGGNRDLWVTGAGKLTIASNLFLSNDTTGRNLYFNVTGAGGAEVTGTIYDTFNNTAGVFGTMATQGTLRKAGAGTLTLSGNSAYKNITNIEGGTLKIGHANALGSSASTDYTSIRGGTLDLNGFSIGEKIWSDTGTNVISNSSATAAAVTTDIGLSNNLTFNTTGNITVERLVASGATRTITKLGAGTLTTQGAGYNNLTAWDIQAGKVIFSNTSGSASDRAVTINGGTLQLSGSNSNLINDAESFTINSGTFDLNGKGEAVASIGGSGGTITNGSATTATLYVGGGSGGSSTASYGGVIQNGTGTLNLTKEGTGTQTLTGASTYTGATTISNGTLALGSSGSINNTSGVSLGNGGTFDISAKTGGYTVSKLSGSGNVVGSLTVSTQLAIGNSPGTTTFDDLTLGGASTYVYELTGGGITADLGLVEGNLTLGSGALLDLVQLGAYTANDKFTLFSYTGILSGTFSGLADGATFTDAGGIWKIDYNDTSAGLNGGTLSGASYVTVTAVPEPRAALLGGLGLLALLRRRK